MRIMTDNNYTIETLITEEEMGKTIRELAQKIATDLSGKEVMLIGVLDGAFVFVSGLSRELLKLGMEGMTIDFIGIDTYGSGTESTGEPKITKDLKRDVQGKVVLIVDDILDTGFSLSILQAMIKARQPKELYTAVMLSKKARRKVNVPVEYIGIEIPDKFVVGYGLDYDGRHRELSYVGAVVFG